MKIESISKRFWLLFFVGLFVWGSVLRMVSYWEFPVAGETQDEIAWSLLGASLLQTGRPVSWSFFQGYEVVKYMGELEGSTDLRLVSPALDHPPLFSLLPGSIVTLLGKNWDVWPSIKVVRFPMVILGMLNVALFLWWSSRSSLSRVGQLVAGVLFTTIPSFVFLSRMVVSENLLVTWILSILLLSTFAKRKAWWWFPVLLVLPLTKISGAAIGLAVVGWLWVEGKGVQRKEFWWAVAGLVGGLLAWLLYAAAYDLALFLNIQMQQSQRDTGFLTFYTSQFFAPTLVEKVFADYWVTLGWIASLAWLAQQWVKKTIASHDRLLAYLFIAQLAFMMLSVGEHTVHGWYRIVFFPLFAYFFASVWETIQKNRSWIGFSVVVLVLSFVGRLGLWLQFGIPSFQWQNTLNRVWLMLAGLLASVELFPGSPELRKRIWVGSSLSLLVFLILAHSVIVFQITAQKYWQDEVYLEQGLRP